ncbi:MAG: hypothetical protein HC908_04300 [Calothrix sp. SM1_7_51]|nr:hypothetical protein [Calothrix sp. SM1_7_51]
MSNELFTELNVEEQEVVAGGFALGQSFTSFFKDTNLLQTVSASGPQGTVSSSTGASEQINTGGSTLVQLGFPRFFF